MAAFAVFCSARRLDPPRILAIGVGFVGVLIALRPSTATLSLPALIALAGSMFYALLMITTRKLRDTPDATLVFGQILGALVFGAIAAPFAWVTPGRSNSQRCSFSGSSPWRAMSASTAR